MMLRKFSFFLTALLSAHPKYVRSVAPLRRQTPRALEQVSATMNYFSPTMSTGV
jgi:hypothetical protein